MRGAAGAGARADPAREVEEVEEEEVEGGNGGRMKKNRVSPPPPSSSPLFFQTSRIQTPNALAPHPLEPTCCEFSR